MADCYCDYDEAPKVYNATRPVAKKQHKCIECGGAIAPGEQYERVFAIYDGVDTYKTCARCLDLRDYVKAHVPCFCWYHYTMIEDAINTAEGWNREAPGLLFGAYRRQVAILRNKATSTEPRVK